MKTSKIPCQGGFTLIELLVGLALGLIASLAIFSTVTTFETQRRTTGSGADMQQNGLLALYSIEQDIRMAGYGLIDPSPFPGSMPCVKVNNVDMAPVKITHGAVSDSLTTHRLDSDIGGIVTGGQAAQLTSVLGVSPITVDTNKAIHLNDYLLIPDANKNCLQLQVTSIPVQSASSVSATMSGTPPEPVKIMNLGSTSPSFSTSTYQIETNFDLNRIDSNGTNAAASNIVNMQMQYGVANAGTQPVTCWTDATGNACSGTNWAAPSAAEIARIKAIRVAIVARSAQQIGNAQIEPCTTTTAAPISWVNGPVIDLSKKVDGSADVNWQCYRYKVYQTIIPVRNVILGNL